MVFGENTSLEKRLVETYRDKTAGNKDYIRISEKRPVARTDIRFMASRGLNWYAHENNTKTKLRKKPLPNWTESNLVEGLFAPAMLHIYTVGTASIIVFGPSHAVGRCAEECSKEYF